MAFQPIKFGEGDGTLRRTRPAIRSLTWDAISQTGPGSFPGLGNTSYHPQEIDHRTESYSYPEECEYYVDAPEEVRCGLRRGVVSEAGMFSSHT